MEDADVTLNDEGQQYGNLDEASAVARTPHKCLVIWCGDHKQTPGGLRKTDEAKAFRRKLLRRPIALRGNTEYVQPNMLGKVVLRYLEDVDDPIVNEIRKMVGETIGSTQPLSQRSVATLRTVCQEVGCAFHEGLCIPVCCTALSVLWLALHKEKFPLLADTLLAAAGVAGKQRWALILPSSARVSMVTYTTVIAVRYPELDHVQNDITCLAIISLVHRVPMEVSSRYFGMHPLLICTQLLTFAECVKKTARSRFFSKKTLLTKAQMTVPFLTRYDGLSTLPVEYTHQLLLLKSTARTRGP